MCKLFKVSNNRNVSKSLPGVFAVRIENRTAIVLPPPFSGYPQVGNYLGEIAIVFLPRLVEFDNIWELTNTICDRYLGPVAA